MICSNCKENPAMNGSMKLPYCDDCFKIKFNNDYEKYWRYYIKLGIT